MSADTSYRADLAWREARDTALDPGTGNAADRMIRVIAAIGVMYAIERDHEQRTVGAQ